MYLTQLPRKPGVMCEIKRNDGLWAVQGHPRSPILARLESPHVTFSDRLQTWATRLSPRMSHTPYRKTHWSRIRRRIVRNFKMSIVSEIKILQTMSANYFSPLPALRPWTPPGISVPNPLGYNPTNENSRGPSLVTFY